MDQVVQGVGPKAFDEGFDFGEQVFDRVEVGRIGRKLEQLTACGVHELPDLLAMMHGPVIHDEHTALG